MREEEKQYKNVDWSSDERVIKNQMPITDRLAPPPLKEKSTDDNKKDK